MNCPPCHKTKSAPKDSGALIVGTITDLSTQVQVSFFNIATGREDRVSVISDAAGLVTVPDFDELGFIMAGHIYEIAVFKLTNTQYTITIGATEYDCFLTDITGACDIDVPEYTLEPCP